MYAFIKRVIQGGLSAISKRRAKVNNPNLSDHVSSLPDSSIVYSDANGLYNYMTKKPLIADFKFGAEPRETSENML